MTYPVPENGINVLISLLLQPTSLPDNPNKLQYLHLVNDVYGFTLTSDRHTNPTLVVLVATSRNFCHQQEHQLAFEDNNWPY